MRRLARLLAVTFVLVIVAQSTSAQSRADELAASLSKEEQLLAPNATITEADITRLQGLTEQIRSAKDPQLLSRAELMIVLFRERMKTKASVSAFDKAINTEARAIRRDRWHRTKRGVVKTSFWIGLTSLGVIGVSQTVSGWATDQYFHTQTLSSATPYFITGKIAQLVSLVGVVGAVGGLGTAWVLEINPFDVPGTHTTLLPVRYPHEHMTTQEKITYLEGKKSDYAKRETRARKMRGVSFGFLLAGLAGVVATGISGYLGNLAYDKYVSSITASDAANYRNMVTLYRYVTIGTGSLALVGLTGAAAGYLFGADPTELSNSIQALDNQLATLQQQQ